MRIALIAMSGVRACDQELLDLGLTLPGFVERSKTIASLPSLGLLTLAALTPSRHVIEYNEIDDIAQADVLPMDYDLVAISSFTAQIPEAYELARRFVAAGVQVVMGGLHVTSVPREAIELGASAVVGEGEVVWGDVLRDAERGAMEDLYVAHGREFDLAQAPMPAYELLDIERYNRLTVQTSRGCPWRCSFCASSILLTDHYKQKPISNVLDEVDRIVQLWPRPFIELADDNSFINKAYWQALLPQLAQRKTRWFAETDVSIAHDDVLLGAMAEAGCKQVLIGFESPIQAGLDGLELRRNWKLHKSPQYATAIRNIQSHGIRVIACFVLGLDGQTPDVFDAVYDFVEQVGPFDVQITYATPFPNTPYYNLLKQQGRLTHDGEWQRYTLFDINHVPSDMTVEQLRAGFFDLAQRLYCDDFNRHRHDMFRHQARNGGHHDAEAEAA